MTFKERREAELLALIGELGLSDALKADGTVNFTYINHQTVAEATQRALGELLTEALSPQKAADQSLYGTIFGDRR